jgi:hypothetical protein
MYVSVHDNTLTLKFNSETVVYAVKYNGHLESEFVTPQFNVSHSAIIFGLVEFMTTCESLDLKVNLWSLLHSIVKDHVFVSLVNETPSIITTVVSKYYALYATLHSTDTINTTVNSTFLVFGGQGLTSTYTQEINDILHLYPFTRSLHNSLVSHLNSFSPITTTVESSMPVIAIIQFLRYYAYLKTLNIPFKHALQLSTGTISTLTLRNYRSQSGHCNRSHCRCFYKRTRLYQRC